PGHGPDPDHHRGAVVVLLQGDLDVAGAAAVRVEQDDGGPGAVRRQVGGHVEHDPVGQGALLDVRGRGGVVGRAAAAAVPELAAVRVGREHVVADRPGPVVGRADLERLAPRVVQLGRVVPLDVPQDVLDAGRGIVVVLDHVGLEGLIQVDGLDLGDVRLVLLL